MTLGFNIINIRSFTFCIRSNCGLYKQSYRLCPNDYQHRAVQVQGGYKQGIQNLDKKQPHGKKWQIYDSLSNHISLFPLRTSCLCITVSHEKVHYHCFIDCSLLPLLLLVPGVAFFSSASLIEAFAQGKVSCFFITYFSSLRDQLHNFWGLVKHENTRYLVQKVLRISRQ